MKIKPGNIISALLVLPAVILFESLISSENKTGNCLVKAGSILKSAGPPSCYSGEPPDNANCTAYGCHDDGIANTGSASVSFDLGAADNGYVPGQTYTVSISINKAGMLRSGFQVIALEDNNTTNSPGAVTLINAARTQLIDINHPHPGPCGNQDTKVWVEHTSAGTNGVTSGTNSWSYLWTAPSSNEGSITFYLAVLESNNSLDETGDNAYTRTKTISALTGIHNITDPNDAIEVYPNPSEGEFHVNAQDGKKIRTFFVFNVKGKLIRKFDSPVDNTMLDIKGQPEGIYFLKIVDGNSSCIKKIVLE